MAARLRHDFEAAVEDLVCSSFTRPDDEPALPLLLEDARRCNPASQARLFWDHFNQDNQDWRDVLGTISVPTLVVAGTASRIVTSGTAEYMAHAIPGAGLEVFEGGGHALFREQPERFNSMLRQFAARCAAARGG